MKRYLKLDENLSPVFEMAIRTLTSRINRKDVVEKCHNTGMPWFTSLFDIVGDCIALVRWERTRELLLDGASYILLKAISGSSFRPLFIEIIYRICSDISPVELEKYRRKPEDWKINQFARQKGR